MTQRMITATVKAAIKEAIKTHPDYAAERIVGLVFEASYLVIEALWSRFTALSCPPLSLRARKASRPPLRRP
jgi:hypothetical protein